MRMSHSLLVNGGESYLYGAPELEQVKVVLCSQSPPTTQHASLRLCVYTITSL